MMNELYNIFPTKEAETPASIVHVDDAAGVPVAKLEIVIEPVQSGTGDPSPSNVRPITGRTGLNVYVSPTQNQADATTYTSDWASVAGTVYGGTLDLVTGVLTVTHVKTVATSVRRIENGNAHVGLGDLNSRKLTYAGCNYLKWNQVGASSVTDDTFSIIHSSAYDGDYAYFKISGITQDSDSYNAKLQEWNENGTPLEFVTVLAESITYQLTPQEVSAVAGQNYVWSDAGNIKAFEYHTEPQADLIPSAYIDGKSLQDDGWYVRWRKLAAPKPKLDLTSIYGRDGSIDQTEVLGDVFYEDRDVNLDMVYIGKDWNTAYSKLMNAVHGQSCAVQFSDDPYWYWSARLVADTFNHKPQTLSMNGVAFPYKMNIVKHEYSATVSGATESTATELKLKGSRMRVSPQVVVTGSVTLKWGDTTKTLSAGTYYVRGLKVGADGVTMKAWGTGSVTISYREGSL